MADTKPAPKTPQLSPTAFRQAEYQYQQYAAVVERGVTPQDALNPAFWAFHATKLKPWDEITIHAEDGTWYGKYVVLDSSRTWTRVFPLQVVRLTSADVAETQAVIQNEKESPASPTYTPKFRGPKGKWSVVRISDNALMTEGLPSKEDAHEWILKQVAADAEHAAVTA